MAVPGASSERKIMSVKAGLSFLWKQGIDGEPKSSFPRLRGPACARSGGEAGAVRERSSVVLSAPQSALAEVCGGGLCLAPTCGRSGAAGDAERGRSFDLSPRPAGAGWRCVALGSRPDPFFCLTLTRWPSKNMAGQSRGAHGAGCRFQAGTALEPRWNRQLTEITAFSSPVPRFQRQASRVRRACACVRTRAYTRGDFAVNLEPLQFIYLNQVDRGSKSVPNRFLGGSSLEPLGTPRDENGGILRKINKIGGGYSTCLSLGIVLGARSTVIRGRAAKTFGLGARAAGAGASIGLGRGGDLVRGDLDQVRCGADRAAGRNGGIPPFSHGPAARVGTVMLEGMSERRGNAGASARGRMPVRLPRTPRAEGPRGSIGAPSPPLAPFAPSLLPSTLAHERAQIWTECGSSDRGDMQLAAKGAQSLRSTIGSGCGFAWRKARGLTAGRGMSADLREDPRRRLHGTTGGAHVN